MGMLNTIAEVKYSHVLATNEIVFEDKDGMVITELPARSVVCFNAKGKAYILSAKVRNTDLRTMLTAVLKGMLAATCELEDRKASECVRISKYTTPDFTSPILRCHAFGATNKYGALIQSSVVEVCNGLTLRDIKFKANKKTPIYDLVVTQRLGWGDEAVQTQLKAWVESAVTMVDYCERVDKAINKAAESNNTAAPMSEEMNDDMTVKEVSQPLVMLPAVERVAGKYVEFEEVEAAVVAAAI